MTRDVLERPVRDFMHGDPVVVDLGASLKEIADAMADEETGSVLVTDLGQLVGIVTERDLATAASDDADFACVFARDVMTEGPFCVEPDESLASASVRMVRSAVQHLPVISAGRPVGMLSGRDLIRAFVSDYLDDPSQAALIGADSSE